MRRDYGLNCSSLDDEYCTPYYEPMKKCNFIIKPKKIINIYEEPLKNYIKKHPFTSSCLKCATCLAVASEIHAIFSESVEGCTKKYEVENIIRENLDNLCKNGYGNYDLREYKSLHILTNNHKLTTHVNTEMNGKWPEKLREITCLFKEHIDVNNLYKHYIDGPFNMTDYLCRNGGIFRDCINVQIKEVILPNTNQGIITYIFNCFRHK
ncbi:hypothetical protein WA026_011431 [Henosepilachna vigintioctopunctata]|uniref:Uncharacterized protein n=1 Tax=Henosepilachna vigintioctopunctata TaxID=420089 RepID=A0AAW1TS33_9CUCU